MTKRESMAYRLIENWAELGQRDSYTGHVAPWEDQPEGLRRRALKDVDVILEELMEPSEDMRTEGLLAYSENEEKLREYYNRPENQARDYGESKMMPTSALLVRSEDDSNQVWRAMLTAIKEGK